MSDVFEKFAALRAKFPDDVERIREDEEAVSELLKQQEFANLEITKRLLDHCRGEIVSAQRRLATERRLSDEERADLWLIIEARQWFLKMVVQDFDSELAQLDRQLESELGR